MGKARPDIVFAPPFPLCLHIILSFLLLLLLLSLHAPSSFLSSLPIPFLSFLHALFSFIYFLPISFLPFLHAPSSFLSSLFIFLIISPSPLSLLLSSFCSSSLPFFLLCHSLSCMPRIELVLSQSALLKFPRHINLVTPVTQLSSQTMWTQIKAAPKQIEPQKRAWSHLKDLFKSFQMRPSSFL